MSKIKVGDKIVFGRGKKNNVQHDSGNIIIGKVYEVTECCGCPAINESEHLSDYESSAKITKVVD